MTEIRKNWFDKITPTILGKCDEQHSTTYDNPMRVPINTPVLDIGASDVYGQLANRNKDIKDP